jgi:hypothetical protein
MGTLKFFSYLFDEIPIKNAEQNIIIKPPNPVINKNKIEIIITNIINVES